MKSSESAAPAAHDRLTAWTELIDALGSTAAIVDSEGVVLASNRPAEVVVGSRISQRTQAAGQESASPEHTWNVRSITEDGNFRLAATAASDPSEMLMQQFFFLADRLFVVYDTRGRILQANKAWRELLGYDLEKLFSLSSWDLLPASDQTTRASVERELREQCASEPIYQMRTASGNYRTVRWSLQFDPLNNRCYGIGRDITDELQATRDLTRRAFTDDLTGLANRPALLEALDLWLNGPFTPALLFCDLDGFKRINDSLGHQNGDALLVALAERLNKTIVGPDSVVARFGGDEFVVLLGAATADRATVTASQILQALEEPFHVAGHDIHLSMSIGIGIAEEFDEDEGREHAAEVLLEHSDVAAYEAKRSGTARWVLYNDRSNVAERNRFHLERDLRSAIANEEFDFLYQPIRSLPDGRCCGAEAIPSWRRQEGSVMDHRELVALAEESGLGSEMGALISRTAFRHIAGLPVESSSFLIAIPAAGRELAFPGFPVKVLAEIADARLDPSQVLIQISESVTLESAEMLPQITPLHNAGVRLALDDFGMGYSPMRRLAELPIGMIRIDQNMATEATDSQTSRKLSNAIISTFKSMGLDVILEGATTPEEAHDGHLAGAQMVQGELFDPPRTIDELRQVVLSERDGGNATAA